MSFVLSKWCQKPDEGGLAHLREQSKQVFLGFVCFVLFFIYLFIWRTREASDSIDFRSWWEEAGEEAQIGIKALCCYSVCLIYSSSLPSTHFSGLMSSPSFPSGVTVPVQ